MAGKAFKSISIGYLLTILCATSLEQLEIQRQRGSGSNIITLLCKNTSTGRFVQNAEFWKNSRYRIRNFTYGDHLNVVNTTATISLTPQDEGNYSCRDPRRGNTSSDHIVLLAYPQEKGDTQDFYRALVGQTTTIPCPFPRGALDTFYSHQWLRGFMTLQPGSRYIFNDETFELTILNTSFTDNASNSDDDGYMCRVSIEPPANNGNSWTKSSRPIGLLVTNSTPPTTTDVSTVLPTSVLPSPTVTMRDRNGGKGDTNVAAIVAGTLVPLLLVVLTIILIPVAVAFIRRRKEPERRRSVDEESTVGNCDERSHASTSRVSDTDVRHQVSEYALKCLSKMNGGPQSPTHPINPQSPNLDSNPQSPSNPRGSDNGFRACSEQRTHNTACSSSLFLKQLESRGDYSATSDVEFVGSIQVVDCDRQGGEYHDKEHAMKICIHKDPFHRDDVNRESIELEIGIAIHGYFKFPDNWKPVSPILWLNVAEDFSYEFGKNVHVELPHFLQLRTDEIASMSKQLGWMLAYFNPEDTQLGPIEFALGNSRSFHFLQRTGKIVTKRGCYMCLCATRSVLKTHSTFCLVSAIERPVGHSHEQNIFFFVCYHLNTFIEVIKKDLKSLENFTQHQFTFTPDSSDEVKISINFGSKSASKGWQLTLASDTSEVTAKAVELWENDVSDLRLRMQHKRYPPRVKITATPSGKTQNSNEVFTVVGARFIDRKKATVQIPLVVL